jgi:hypothetical protein
MNFTLLNSRFARRWCTKGLVESGVHHPKWDEQPLLLEQIATPDEILQFMDGRSQSSGGPMTWCSSTRSRATTSKILKAAPCDQFKTYRLPADASKRGVKQLKCRS